MTITIDFDAVDFAFYLADLTLTVAELPPATPADRSTRWRVVVRGVDGSYRTEYASAVVNSITWNPPNQVDEAEVLIPIDELNTQAFRQDQSPHREIEIWRNDVKLFVGPPTLIRADSTSRTFTVTLKDPTWYLTRRYVGRPSQHNVLSNGSFESNGSGWTLVNGSGVTDTFSTSRFYIGTKSLKLVGTNVNAARYYKQTVTVTSGVLGLPLTLSGYCFIEHWLRPGAYGGGMLLLRDGVLPDPSAYSVAEVVSSTPRGRWVRLTTSVRVKPSSTEHIEVWLFAIGGTIYWDNIRLDKGESLAFEAGEDQGSVVHDLIDYAQGRGRFASLATEKSDCFIRAVMPTTGVPIAHRQYFLADRQKLFDGNGPGSSAVLDEYLNKANGIDWRFNPATRNLVGFYPSVGTTRSEVTFTWRIDSAHPELDATWGIVGWTYGASIESAAGQISELGGQGGQAFTGDPSREVGGYDDAGVGLGGLTLELVESGPPNAKQNQLNDLAEKRGDQLQNPVATPQLVLAEPRDPITNEVVYPLIGQLLPGDHIFVDVLDGSFAMTGEYRVAQVVLDAQAETLTVTPNPVPV